RGQAVSIGLTSYDGGVYFGLNADREGLPDVEVLAQCIDDAIEEMLATVTVSGKARRPRKPTA
ncbi:MAG TPA: WS/DGAT domain-containing protein, partial [Candidatus Limnocylindrales bacterium]|nr:WS/DGAT domain-containing protein [Candidatus Limnocylindrales bacterium]